MTDNGIFGQYLPGNSFLHQANPCIKILVTLIYTISCTFISNMYELAVSVFFLSIAMITSHLSISEQLRYLKPMLFFLLLTSSINLFFVQSGTILFETPYLQITSDGLNFAFLYTLRFVLLILAAILLLITTTQTALFDALEKLFKPLCHIGIDTHDLIFTLNIALNFVPILAEEAHSLIEAQTARGAAFNNKNVIKRLQLYVPLLIPLIASSLRHAENLSLAMDSRCYMNGNPRTSYHRYSFSFCHDGVLVILLLSYLLILFIV